MNRYNVWATYLPAAIFAFILSGVYEMALGDAAYTDAEFSFWVLALLGPFVVEAVLSARE